MDRLQSNNPKRMRKHTQVALTSEASGKDEDNTFFSSIATRRFSRRCIKDGNKDKVLPRSLENPTIFKEQSSAGNSTKCSSDTRASVFAKKGSK